MAAETGFVRYARGYSLNCWLSLVGWQYLPEAWKGVLYDWFQSENNKPFQLKAAEIEFVQCTRHGFLESSNIVLGMGLCSIYLERWNEWIFLIKKFVSAFSSKQMRLGFLNMLGVVFSNAYYFWVDDNIDQTAFAAKCQFCSYKKLGSLILKTSWRSIF